MKRISTLFALLCSFVITTTASAQISEGFNSQTEFNSLVFNCWSFNRVTYTNTDLSTGSGSGSLLAQENSSSTFTTPFVDLQTGNLAVSFKYEVLTPLKNGNNSIKINLLTSNGSVTLHKFALDEPAGIVSFSRVYTNASVTGSKMVQIEVVNGNLQIDDFSINASPTAGACISQSLLPVKLSNFQGAVNNNKGLLKWAVADNETGEYFQVMRSTDGKNFTEAGVVLASNKVGAESYTFTDVKELEKITYYKLKVINKNKSVTYSNTVIIRSSAEAIQHVLSILSNPVESALTFSYHATLEAQNTVVIYNTSGAKVFSTKINVQKGTNSISLKVDSHLQPGMYILEVWDGTVRNVAKLIKK